MLNETHRAPPRYKISDFFSSLLELEDGLSIEEIMEQFDVTREQVTAVLDFAARSLEAPIRGYCSFSLTTERPEAFPAPCKAISLKKQEPKVGTH